MDLKTNSEVDETSNVKNLSELEALTLNARSKIDPEITHFSHPTIGEIKVRELDDGLNVFMRHGIIPVRNRTKEYFEVLDMLSEATELRPPEGMFH